jgi:hypothetical protein
MDILQSESSKRVIKWGLWLLRKKLGEQANVKAIHDDLENCGNLVIKRLNDINTECANKVKCDHQKNIQIELVELFLWIAYKDTAYRCQFFFELNEILKNSDELQRLIKPYLKQPKDFHVNVWMDSKEETKKQTEEGKIGKGQVSFAESCHVPSIQRKRLSEIASRQIKR